MLNETRIKIKESFNVLCPEISISEKELDVYIDLVEPMLSEKVFGSMYVTAFVFLMAHHIVMRKLIVSGGDTGAANMAITSEVTSEKEGDLQRSYGSRLSGGSTATDTLDKTFYGLEFKRIRAMCIVPIITRVDNIL